MAEAAITWQVLKWWEAFIGHNTTPAALLHSVATPTKVEFAIGSYHDSIDCDVVPM
jgi:hypothetical protein